MKFVREKRIASKMTLKDVATAAGISECFASQIETGQRRPSVEVAKRIAAVLGFEWTRFFEDGQDISA